MTQPVPGVNWNYSGLPSVSQMDEVRFLCQDADPDLPWLLDSEITYLINKWMPLRDSVTYVAAMAAALIARKVAALGEVQADGVSVTISGVYDHYMSVAQDLREEYNDAQETGDVDLTSLELDTGIDTSIRPLNFSIGMHDNPEAGMQDYGGYYPYAWNIEWGATR